MTLRRKAAVLACLLLAAAGLVWRGRRPPAVTREEQHPTAPASPLAMPAPATPPPPPRPAEARDALARVFGGTVSSAPADPAFLAADFNGDGSQDIAVVVTPAGNRLREINDNLANWIVEDVRTSPPTDLESRGEPARVEAGDALLAVLHGHGPAGWRSPDARQAYLLRNAVGVGMARLRMDEAPAGGGRTPKLLGDVLAEKLDGRPGFVYWTGARYAYWRLPARASRLSPTP